ncbi:MAG: hypothetical protein D6793_11105, partial [Thermoflexia bacterium]
MYLRRSGIGRGWWVVLLGIVLALLFWQWTRFRASLQVLPPELAVADATVEGMTLDQVLATLESAYLQPVQLSYQGRPLLLAPDTVEFRLDREATRAVIEAAVAGRNSLQGFLAYLLRRPFPPVAVMPVVQYSPNRLDRFLERVAQQYDRPPQEPVPLPEALAFRPGQPG